MMDRAREHAVHPSRRVAAAAAGAANFVCILTWFLIAAVVGAVPSKAELPCEKAVAEADVRLRSAQYREALAGFDALIGGACGIEARLGRASVLTSMGQRKDALAAADAAFAATDDPMLQARARFERGRALHERGRKLNKKRLAAEAAYLEAIERAGGDFDAAVRALARLYRETNQDDKLAALRKRNDRLRLRDRKSQHELAIAQDRKDAKAARALIDRCRKAKHDDPGWKAALPAFTDEGAEPGTDGFRAPTATKRPAVSYPGPLREAELEGEVEVQMRLDAKGQVLAARALDEAIEDLLAQAAVAQVCGWRFEPAKTDADQAVSAFYTVRVRFVDPEKGENGEKSEDAKKGEGGEKGADAEKGADGPADEDDPQQLLRVVSGTAA